MRATCRDLAILTDCLVESKNYGIGKKSLQVFLMKANMWARLMYTETNILGYET
jgi:hypothetical protein